MTAKHTPDTKATEPVEALLRAAAPFEPTEPAPADWIARALERKNRRYSRTAWPLTRLRWASVTVVAAAALVALLILRSAPREAQSVRNVAATPAPPAVSIASAPSAPPEALPSKPVSLVSAAAKRSEPPAPPSPRPASGASARATARRVSPRRPARPAPRQKAAKPVKRRDALPHVEVARSPWKTEIVRRDTVGVLAPVWLAEEDEARGATVVTPVVVQVPLHTQETVAMRDTVPAGGVLPVHYEEESFPDEP